MGFLDRFIKPKYKSDDYKTRDKAINKLKDYEILIDLINENGISSYTAEKRLKYLIENEYDEETLMKLAKTDDNKFNREAVYKINNQDILKEIIYTANDFYVVESAIHRLKDENLLINIAYNHEKDSVRSKAILRIHNQEVLLDLYNSSNSFIRRDTVINITDQTILKDMLKNESDHWVKEKIVENPNLTDQDILKELTKDEYPEIRLLAYRKITDYKFLSDEKILTDIALHSFWENECYDAIKKIANEENLIKIAQQSKKDNVRSSAIRRINNEKILADIVKNDESPQVRLSALSKIKDTKLLKEISNYKWQCPKCKSYNIKIKEFGQGTDPHKGAEYYIKKLTCNDCNNTILDEKALQYLNI